MIKLNIGSHDNPLEGWINIDPVPGKGVDLVADINDLKYEFASVDEMNLNCVYEHFQRHEGLKLLKRFSNWIKPGGKITVVVPDFWGTVKKLKKSSDVYERAFWYRHLFGPQADPRFDNHLDGFDKERLKEIFTISGFVNIKVKSFGTIPYLRVVAEVPSVLWRMENADTPGKYADKVAKYLIAHEFRGVATDCYPVWIKDLECKPDLPKMKFKTHKDGFVERLKNLIRPFIK